MSVVSNAANYGGKIVDNMQGVKQFFVSDQGAISWIFKTVSNGVKYITPMTNKVPVLINNDLIVSGSIYNTSDERLKYNINNITKEQSELIFTLNPINFSYINDPKNKLHHGFLAQDVEKVFPELVENNFSGYKTVNYQELIPVMLMQMKCMQKSIDELSNNKN
jgi:hypothetical protein